MTNLFSLYACLRYETDLYFQTFTLFIRHFFLVVGRVPGDYPVPAGYCTTRHYPDPAGYYVKMWPDPSNLSNSIS